MKWIKLHEDAIIPTRGTEESAGYDFYANETVRILPNQVAIVKTGITFEGMPKNGFIQLSLRSSISIKRPFLMANGVGIIDADYAGNEIGIILYNRGTIPAIVDKGEKIAQGILLKYNTVSNEEKPTKKRVGGYGSTGN
jgi:dUTP pyrophosphatase